MAYKLELTEDDVNTINHVGNRYGWSDALCSYDAGTHDIPEHKAWELREAFESDTEGGHSYFPMLQYGCALYDKLLAFMDSIV